MKQVRAIKWFTEHTGGGFMLDFVLFDNGTYATIDDNSIALHECPMGMVDPHDLVCLWTKNGENQTYYEDHYDANPVYNHLLADYDALDECTWITSAVNNIIVIQDLSMVEIFNGCVVVTDPLAVQTRLPKFYIDSVTTEYCDSWIERLFKAGLAYHFEDDPRTVGNIIDHKWVNMFTRIECRQLDRIIAHFDEIECYDPFIKLCALQGS